MAKMNRASPVEVLRSCVFYVVFYLGTIAYVLTAFCAQVFGPGAFQAVAAAWSRFHRDCARVLLGIKVEFEGTLPQAGALVAIKHESFFEALDLPNLFATPAIFAKAELLRIPLWGKAGAAYGLIPVERDQGARALRTMLAEARRQAAAGRVLVIFPEGTRVRHCTHAPLQAGFAGLYKILALPVVPVAVDSGSLYHRRWKQAGTIRYRVGEPIPPGLPRAEIEARVQAAINTLNPPGGSGPVHAG